MRITSNMSHDYVTPGSDDMTDNTSRWSHTPDVLLPREMRFTNDNLFTVVSYALLFTIAAGGNLTIFITLFRNRHRKSRVNMFIMHLCIADLVVTFVMMPLEVAWQLTVDWRAGEAACRILMFFRAFGFYLSSFILVCMSLDRYFAILKPLSITDADTRGRIMLTLAWTFSIIASIPQSVIFHLEKHPEFPWFLQCVTFNFFPSHAHELAYNIFNFVTIYVFPLIVITTSYVLVLNEISRKTKENNGGFKDSPWRQSGNNKIQIARIKTLKMTLMIVFVFVICWTPYYVISVWWWFDKETANDVSPKIQRGLFLFAVSSCCMDPIVYGSFSIDFTTEFRRCCCLFRRRRPGGYHKVMMRPRSDPYRLHCRNRTPPRQTSRDKVTSSVAMNKLTKHDSTRPLPHSNTTLSTTNAQLDKTNCSATNSNHVTTSFCS